MSKFEKEQGILKPRDLKKIDIEPSEKGQPKKKRFPPHWQFRSYGLSPSKNLHDKETWKYAPECRYIYKHSEEFANLKNLLKTKQLDAALEIYTKHHPETKNWPIRFINVPIMPTTREVIQ